MPLYQPTEQTIISFTSRAGLDEKSCLYPPTVKPVCRATYIDASFYTPFICAAQPTLARIFLGVPQLSQVHCNNIQYWVVGHIRQLLATINETNFGAFQATSGGCHLPIIRVVILLPMTLIVLVNDSDECLKNCHKFPVQSVQENLHRLGQTVHILLEPKSAYSIYATSF